MMQTANEITREIILLKISGEDKPGVTAPITEVLASHEVHVLDIGQAVIHNALSLGILIEIPDHKNASDVLRDVLFRAHQLELQVRYDTIPEYKYESWVANQGKMRYIVTLLGKKLSARQLADLSRIIYEEGLNIDKIQRLTGRISLKELHHSQNACVEFSIRGMPENSQQFRAKLFDFGNNNDVDVSFQLDSVYRRIRRLVVFDMDSTLINTEVIDELAKAVGVGEQVAGITEQAMRGEIGFDESFRKRVALLKGLDESVLKKIAARLPLNEGAERVTNILRSLGFKTAILSGGFTYFGYELQKRLKIDYVYANELDIRNGKVTGKVAGRIVNGKRKAELLHEIARKEGIHLEQVIAVGDGANDLPMINEAGLGIAFRAKPMVREQSRQTLTHTGLDGILYLLGMRDRDIMNEKLVKV
ncbi:MAG: phosphoserine phosphatase SerB [Balneolales bacterium]